MNEPTGESISPACQGCVKFKIFSKSCWYYWEGKKVCSMREEE